MKQEIQLRAMVLRDGRLLLVRPGDGGPWELPGGLFAEGDDDMDSAMDAMLSAMGIEAPAVDEDFVETLFLREGEGQVVYNLYAPTEWTGDPKAAPGAGLSWFALDELELLEMDPRVRNGVLRAFGLQATDDNADEILSKLELQFETPGPNDRAIEGSDPPPSNERHARGRDVLRTLRAGAPGAEDGLRKAYPELADDILGALGDTWARPEIDRKTSSLQVVAMLAALGREGALRSHIDGALNHGVSPEQIVETLRMVAVYAGFPASLAAWPVMEQVFAARGIERGART
jgi:alkylhydroperoxidase/carboxymuconolactone decarboxylase family protein YurZ